MTGAAPTDFWSRRRAAVRAEEEARASARRPQPAAADEGVEDAPRSDADILAELGLCDPDAMGPGDDFSAFLRDRVPLHLRQRALRRLWRTNPVLANLDGLVDHGEDYSDAATVQEGMQTAYQVGRGMMEHLAALAREGASQDDVAVTDADGDETGHDVAADMPGPPAEPEDMVETAPDELAGEEHMAERPLLRRGPRFTFAQPS